jgi:hypothetical protein
MEARLKRQILEQRGTLLRGHIRTVGSSEGFERELGRVEAQLTAQQEPQREESPHERA